MRIAVTVGPDLGQLALLADEGIVVGDRAVGIDAHDLADMARKILRRTEFEAVAERDEQLAVGAEGKPRAEMVAAIDLRLLPEDDLDIVEAAVAQLPARDRRSRAAFARLRIGQVDKAVLGESGIERDVEKSPLAFGDHLWHAFQGFGDAPSFVTIRKVPDFSVTSMRPSGRKARPQGLLSPFATLSTLIGPCLLSI